MAMVSTDIYQSTFDSLHNIPLIRVRLNSPYRTEKRYYMIIVNEKTRLGHQLIERGSRYEGIHLRDVYTKWSESKEKAWNYCYNLYLQSEEHEAFSIISHNAQFFSVSWLCKQGLRIETPTKSYLVVFENE